MDDAVRALERTLERATLDGSQRDVRSLERQTHPPEHSEMIFVGTGGSALNLIRQQRQTAGFYIELPEVRMYVDPGPGAVAAALRCQVPIEDLDAVYVSHIHTDHVAEAGAMTEAMCRAMTVRRGALLAPAEAFREGVVTRFHQGRQGAMPYPGGPTAITLEAGRPVTVGAGARLTPVAVHHAAENYGFVLETPSLTIGYTSDTGYVLAYRNADGDRVDVEPGRPIVDFEAVEACHLDLKAAFRDVDVLVANVTFMNHHPTRQLTAIGLAHLLSQSQVRLCILTHLGTALAGANGEDKTPLLAEYVERVSTVPTRLARDGMRVHLPPAGVEHESATALDDGDRRGHRFRGGAGGVEA